MPHPVLSVQLHRARCRRGVGPQFGLYASHSPLMPRHCCDIIVILEPSSSTAFFLNYFWLLSDLNEWGLKSYLVSLLSQPKSFLILSELAIFLGCRGLTDAKHNSIFKGDLLPSKCTFPGRGDIFQNKSRLKYFPEVFHELCSGP